MLYSSYKKSAKLKKGRVLKMKELLEKYDIESIEDFRPKFYTMNLTNRVAIEDKAIKNLYARGYTNEELIKVKNYTEIGIVEYVANDKFYIENDYIIREED